MAKKDNNYYFDVFVKGIAYANDAAVLLQECFENFQADDMKKRFEEMHEIEHTADTVKHEMMERLMKEFLPPLEREDIVELSHRIDDVTDAIEGVMLRIYMYNVKEVRADVVEFAKLITRCCEALGVVSKELHNYRKSTILLPKVHEVNSLEEEGDRLYAQAMHRLYEEETDAVSILTWTKIYDCLEKCCDCCEKVMDTIELVIMKNS